MRKLFLLNFIIAFCTFELHATQPNGDAYKPSAVALQNFKQSEPDIKNHLDTVDNAQLHFFWTTGRTISDNPDYQQNKEVEVGGAKYGQKFFAYLQEILEHSPDKLKINFVCDTLTKNSNSEAINLLQNKHGKRFNLLSIESVHANLLQNFSQDYQKAKINILFKNATQGNPVIASDVYRIFMIYGQNDPASIATALHAYCDVDAFCYGMELSYYQDLIKALFKPVDKSPFYFGRSQNNNDVIKICVKDLNSYNNFCCNQLNKLNTNGNVITYFSELHDMIKKCETDSEYCLNILKHIPDPISNLILQVMQTTGPNFLFGENITTDLSYPSEMALEWGDKAAILDYSIQRYKYTHPPSVLDWGFGPETPEEKLVSDDFIQDCEIYRKVLSVYSYAKRFGEKHPFNVQIKNYLLDLYPYQGNSFKSLLSVNFAIHNKEKRQIFRLSLMKDLPKNPQYYSEGNMYIGKNENNKLDIVAILSGKKLIQSSIDYEIKEDLKSGNLWDHRSKILQQATAKGITMQPKPGKTYEEWKEETLARLHEDYRQDYHYQTLNRVLKDMGIIFPLLTLESLDFKK